MRSVVFADIDGTLVESVRRRGSPTGATIGARDRAGNQVAIQTDRHRELLRILASADIIVPVTGRSIDALRRVEIPFNSYAIAHHGAVVLSPSGERCTAYDALATPELAVTHGVLSSVFESTLQWIESRSKSLRVYQQVLDGRTIEVCVKHLSPNAETIGEEGDEIEADWRGLSGVRVHRNGNNLALLPDGVTKESAVRWVTGQLDDGCGTIVTFGIGDSETDLGFMHSCDYYLVPRGSQLDLILRSKVI